MNILVMAEQCCSCRKCPVFLGAMPKEAPLLQGWDQREMVKAWALFVETSAFWVDISVSQSAACRWDEILQHIFSYIVLHRRWSKQLTWECNWRTVFFFLINSLVQTKTGHGEYALATNFGAARSSVSELLIELPWEFSLRSAFRFLLPTSGMEWKESDFKKLLYICIHVCKLKGFVVPPQQRVSVADDHV